jgi:hypothetical protein
MLKRLMGKFLVLGLLSGGAVFAAASPSSAARDNPCMDQANFDSQYQWLQDTAYDFLYIQAAWENAYYFSNPLTGYQTWYADPSGTGNLWEVHTLADYLATVSKARYRADNAQNNIAIFLDFASVCP